MPARGCGSGLSELLDTGRPVRTRRRAESLRVAVVLADEWLHD